MTIFNVINLAGGIALFLYGMSIMGAGLENWLAASWKAFCSGSPVRYPGQCCWAR